MTLAKLNFWHKQALRLAKVVYAIDIKYRWEDNFYVEPTLHLKKFFDFVFNLLLFSIFSLMTNQILIAI